MLRDMALEKRWVLGILITALTFSGVAPARSERRTKGRRHGATGDEASGLRDAVVVAGHLRRTEPEQANKSLAGDLGGHTNTHRES